MIGDYFSKMAAAQKLPPEQLAKSVKNNVITPNMATDAASGQPRRAAQPGIQGLQQPPIADQVMQEADQVVAPDRLMQQISSLKSSIAEVQQGVQSGKIEAYKGIPFIKEQLSTLQQLEARLQPMQGIDSAPSNLPTEMAGGGIVAFDDGGLSEDDEDDTDNQKQDLAMFQRNLAAMAGDSGEDDDEEFDDEEMPQGIMAAMSRGKETENRGVGINPESKGGIGIKDVIAAKAAENKLPPELLNKIAGIESGYKSTAANPNSTAKGLFQFTDSTWKGMGGKQGEQFDPEKNAELGAKFVRQNAEGLKGALGRNPTYGEVYASHFFGLKGAKDILNMDPKTPMNQAVSAQVLKANPQLRDKTVGQVMAGLNNKMGEGIVSLAGGGVVAFKKGGTDGEELEEDDENFIDPGTAALFAPSAYQALKNVKKLPPGALSGAPTAIGRTLGSAGKVYLGAAGETAVPAAAVGYGGYKASQAAARTMARPEMAENRKVLQDNSMLGAMSGDTAFASAILDAAQNNPKPAPAAPDTQEASANTPSITDITGSKIAGDDFRLPVKETDNERQAREDAAKADARKATGAGSEDYYSLKEMLDERSKSAKNQKSIDNYMALLQAGLGMMGGTSPYAAANIGQGASKGIAHLADARKAQIADENALLSGRLGLSRAQLYEQSRKDALARGLANDKFNRAYKTSKYGLDVQKARQTETHNAALLNIKTEELYEKKGGDLALEQEFAKQYGSNWKNDLRYKHLFDIERQQRLDKLRGQASVALSGVPMSTDK
jgi:hypothetical protein